MRARKRVERTLHALRAQWRIRVQRRRQPSPGQAHIGEEEAGGGNDLGAGHLRVCTVRVTRVLPHQPRAHRRQIRRIVAEHLFKVGHVPLRVCAVPGDPAAQLVTHATSGDVVQRGTHHGQRVVVEVGPLHERLQDHRRWELRSPAESAGHRVEAVGQLFAPRGEFLSWDGWDGWLPCSDVSGEVGKFPFRHRGGRRVRDRHQLGA